MLGESILHEIGEHDGRAFIAMEYVEGRKVLDYIMQICEGLAAAHKNGIVHRDIKSGNILVRSAVA